MDTQFIEGKLNRYAQTIIDRGERRDEHALGELKFYVALRRVLEGHGTPEDLGLMDAINNTLQAQGILPLEKTFLHP